MTRDRAPLPFRPMPLARRRDPFDHPDWIFEPKVDGFRCVAYLERGRVRLVSRNAREFRSWPGLCDAVAKSVRATSAVLDGEVVCVDDDGRPNFRALLFRRAEPVYYVFDVMWLDGRDLRGRPLVERKLLLRRIVPRRRADRLRYLDHVVGRGVDLFRAVCDFDMEGIVAKRRDGLYDPERTTWWKTKHVAYSQARDRWELFERRTVSGRRC